MRASNEEDAFATDLEPGEKAVFFEEGHLLEGKFGWPELPADGPQTIEGGVVVAHPYPLGGADMDLPLVFHVARGCRSKGLASLRFNFRGVGRSRGNFSGSEEHRDVEAAFSYMKTRLAPHESTLGRELPVMVAGWSFGSMMAARAVPEISGSAALALIGFPLDWDQLPADTLERLAGYEGPVLAVCAENDHHGDPTKVERALSKLGLDLTVEVVRGADHYLQGRHREVAALVAEFFAFVSRGRA